MYSTIDQYISEFWLETQNILNKIRKIIKSNAHEAQEAITYNIPTFKLNWNLVHFAAFKNHIGFYPTPSWINQFKDELSQFKTSKWAIQFPLDKEIPYNLIEKMVKYRVEENMKKTKL